MAIPDLKEHKRLKAKGLVSIFDPGNNKETYAYYRQRFDTNGDKLPDEVLEIKRSEVVAETAEIQARLAELQDFVAELDLAKPAPKVK